MGSGSLAAMAVFEAGWQPNMTVRLLPRSLSSAYTTIIYNCCLTLLLSLSQREEALTLVTAAISAGIFNDLGSGSNVDACVITSSRTEMLRNFVKPNERVEKERSYGFRRGVTAWKKEEIRKLIVSEEVVEREGEEMDVS